MCNGKIRAQAALKGVRLWEVAERLGLKDSNFSRKLRQELPEEEQKRIIKIIDELAMNRG